MIYLNSAEFKPFVILISVAILPVIISLLILNLFAFRISLLVILMMIVVGFVVAILVVYNNSKTKKYYLKVHKTHLELKYPNIGNGRNELKVEYENIIRLEYYKITSFRAWLMLYNYVLPKCVYITYTENGNVINELIGYMNYDDVKKISENNVIELKVY